MTSQRIKQLLGISRPIRIWGTAIQVVDCAGLIRVAPNIELEVVPKFLDADDGSWREDFFLIATLSRTGHLLARDRLAAGPAASRDLPTLVAATMIDLFRRNERQPLRIYRHRAIAEFAIDGDVDPEEIFLPDPAGFQQNVTVFDRDNEFNSTIRTAVQALLPEVRHTETRMQLMRVYERISPQSRGPRHVRDRMLPNRHRSWQPMYDLAVQVLQGFGADFSGGGFVGPGFVLKTWSAWENLIEVSLREGLPEFLVHGQEPFDLGTRNGRSFRVWPDVTAYAPNNQRPRLLVDAKYKVAREVGRRRIAEADLYESLAFLKASGGERALLLYPCEPQNSQQQSPGTIRIFERVQVGLLRIWGAEVEVRGIATASLATFASELGEGVRQLVK